MKPSSMARALFLVVALSVVSWPAAESKKLSSATYLPIPEGGAGPDPNRYIVRYNNAKGLEAVKSKLGGGGIHEDLKPQMAVAVNLSLEAVEGLKRDPDIRDVEQDPVRSLHGASLSSIRSEGGDRRSLERNAGRRLAELTPYGIPMVQADQLSYDSSSAASAKKVCIIDTGYDDGHPDLPTGASGTVTFDPASGPRRADEDIDLHGTHVAGTVAAIGNNGVGVRGVIDDPAVPLHIVRVYLDRSQFIYASGLVGAVNNCVANGADVVTISIGCGAIQQCYSRFEEEAFASADFNDGILTFSSAGNDASNALSFPASYDAVVSVGAVDPSAIVTSYSQKNEQVELVAPGDSVLSTVPRGFGYDVSFSFDGNDYEAAALRNTVSGNVVAPLFCCDVVDGYGSQGDCEGATGKICLIQRRGAVSFSNKVQECARAGGVAAVIYNDVPGIYARGFEASVAAIPAVTVSQDTGTAAKVRLGDLATVYVQSGGNYDYLSGTSMASPHAAAVAAIVWSNHPGCSNYDIRNALRMSAIDFGDVGDDDSYGHGLVQAKAASEYLVREGCTGASAPSGGSGGTCRNGLCAGCAPRFAVCIVGSDCCSGNCKGASGKRTCR